MLYDKTILCLANSRKISGRCVAGREIVGKEEFGGWIRPVSERERGEISEHDRRYENGQRAQVLDKIVIRFQGARPHPFQPENHLIDDNQYWKKVGEAKYADLSPLVEQVNGALWINGHSTYHGINDKIPEEMCGGLDGSLKLVRPEALRICVSLESGYQNNPGKRRVRANFRLNQYNYKLQVTDPVVEAEFLAQPDGQYGVNSALLCISLSELIYGASYKLVAAMFTQRRSRE